MADQTFFDCPNCGAEVPNGALACPECGSDDETGWSEDTLYDGLDLPTLDDTTEPPEAKTPSRKQAVFTIAAVLLLIAFFAVYILGIRF